MKFNIVTIDRKIVFDNEKDFISFCEKQGWKQTGVVQSKFKREELQNTPTFKELAGAMYDGEDSVRYETWDAYEMYSN